MLRRQILKDTILLNGSGLINQGLAIVRSFLIMRFLEPQALGIWLGLVVILGYGAYAHLGMEYGLGIRLPYYSGRGEMDRVEKLQDSVYFGWTLLGLIGAAGLAGYAFFWPGLSPLVRTGIAIVACMTVLEQQATFFSRWYTSAEMNFSVPSLIAVIQSAASLLVFVPLAWWLGVAGVMWGSLAIDILVLILWLVWTPYRFRWRLSRSLLWESVRIGMPVLVVVVAGGLIKTVDRLLILTFIGAGALGFYGVTNLGGSFLYGLMSQAGSAISPHIAHAMGRSNDSSEGLEKFLIRPTLAFAYIGAVLILMLTVAVPPMVEILLPKYQPGITAFYFYVPGFFFLGIDLAASNILNMVLIAKKRQRIVIYLQAIAIGVEVGLGWLLIRNGWGIAGVAFASTVAYAIYGMAILVLALHHVVAETRRRIEFIVRTMVPFIYAVVIGLGLFFLRVRVLPENPLIRLGVEGTLALIAIFPMFLRMNTEVAFRKEILPLFMGRGGLIMDFWNAAAGFARRLRPGGSRA